MQANVNDHECGKCSLSATTDNRGPHESEHDERSEERDVATDENRTSHVVAQRLQHWQDAPLVLVHRIKLVRDEERQDQHEQVAQSISCNWKLGFFADVGVLPGLR